MLFYITYADASLEGKGIYIKIRGQVKALKYRFANVYLLMRKNQVAYLMDGDNTLEKFSVLTRREYIELVKRLLLKYSVKYTYIRYPFSELWFIRLIEFQTENNIRTVIEIPTYPYTKLLIDSRMFREELEDRIFRKHIKGSDVIFTTYTGDKYIWDIPCIKLVNGIDMDRYPLHSQKKNKDVVLIAVSTMFEWHGYERLLAGMSDFYSAGGKDVYLWFVGDGPEKEHYKKLVTLYSLGAVVKFYGSLFGEELNRLYNEADVAIGSLGFYKLGYRFGTPLKIGEYCARGLPVVFGYSDMRFEERPPFVLQVSNDATAISIKEILDFYDAVRKNSKYGVVIRKYAETHFTWECVMEPVVQYFQRGVISN